MFAKYHDDFILWIFYIFYILVYFFTFLYVNSYFYYSRRNGIYTDICFGFVTRILLYFAYFYIFYAHFDFCLSMNAWTPTGIVQLLGTIQSRSPNEFYTFWKKSIRFKVYTLMSFGVRGTFVILKDEKKEVFSMLIRLKRYQQFLEFPLIKSICRKDEINRQT